MLRKQYCTPQIPRPRSSNPLFFLLNLVQKIQITEAGITFLPTKQSFPGMKMILMNHGKLTTTHIS